MLKAVAAARPISRDTAAMWSILALALMIQFGLGQAVQALSAEWNVLQLWAIMGTLAALLVIAAYRGAGPVLDQVFAWRAAPVGWIAFAAGVGGLFALLTCSQFSALRPVSPDTLVVATTVGPILEELLYRGFLWCVLTDLVRPNVRGLAGTLVVAASSATLFALMHANPSAAYFWLRFIGGMVNGFLRFRSGSTVPPAVAHLAFNVSVVS